MKDVATMKVELKKLIDTAAGRIPADLVIKNCKIVNVFSGKIQEGDIAFSGNQIAGIGEYEGVKVIDAEGRYYHVGLYLHESKFKSITSSTKSGPAIWGCPLMEYSEDRMGINGLDCSGFVTWAMLNGGFDSKDVGSGNEELIDGELYDYGTHNEITKEYMKKNTYKPGDYIASDGHAALIVGVDEKYVYVAEAYYADVKVSKFEKYKYRGCRKFKIT